MYKAENWKDFEIIDATNFERLERWGDYLLIRPDPQVIWHSEQNSPLWAKANAKYHRSETGGGYWQINNLPKEWQISYRDFIFNIKPMNFKHTGIFPEQAVNWDFLQDVIKSSSRELKVLNLFSYTGAASVACAKVGAFVCHVDAAKGMVLWAKENAVKSSVDSDKIRWIVDDCGKFIQREIRRDQKYDIIIMDPPSYGRGPGGEIWKLEDNIYDFVKLCTQVLSEKPVCVIINSYTTGLAPSVMGYILHETVAKKFGGKIEFDEIGLPVTNSGIYLPAGATARWTA